jgi:UPF0755 protein
MENFYKKFEQDLNNLSVEERNALLIKLRDEIDVIDRELVKLLSKRTNNSVLIGRVKRSLGLATYNAQREKEIAVKISSYVEKPLGKEAVQRIFERIIDESRAIQKEEARKGNIFNINLKDGKISWKKLLSPKQWFGVAGFFFFFLLLLIYTFFGANNFEGAQPKKIQINRGESLSQIAGELYNAKVIPSKFNFKIAAYLYFAEVRIKPGRYLIPSGLSYFDLLDKFISGDGDMLKSVELYDGITVAGLKNRLEKTVEVNPKRFSALINDRTFMKKIGFKGNSLEGYLLPGEYDIFERSGAEEVAEAMYKKFNRFFNDSLKLRASKLGYSVHQVLTLASIVQGETKNETEMPVIAGVYYNRLKKGMRLQADPTVQYLKENGWKRLSFSDLKEDSPYNTYRHNGLPPGPINNPGKKAILAALFPRNHDYLFFVANGKGTHNFSKTFAEHKELAKEYRNKLDSKN